MMGLKWIICGCLAILAVDAKAATATCKANIERFNAAQTPYTNIAGMDVSEMLRHTGWMAQEMAFAVRQGCQPSLHADERAQLQEYERIVQDTIRTCQQMSSGGDCSPKQGAASSGYRRPNLVRPTSGSSDSKPNVNRSSSESSIAVELQQEGANRSSNQDEVAKVEVNQSIDLTQQNQASGNEQARRDKRRRNDKEYEASQCLSVSDQDNPASFGSLTNGCSFKVNYTYCVYRPAPSAWSTGLDCEKQSFGSGSARPGGKGFGHMKGGEAVLLLGCREPALALDGRFENGRISGRCRVIGGQ